MKRMLALPLALSFAFAKTASAADEIHWTITGPDSVSISWHGANTESTISFGLPGGTLITANATHPVPLPVTAQGTFWEARLGGLKANTVYNYKIGKNPAHTFKTAPAQGAANFSIFAQGTIGDSTHFKNTKAIQNIIAGYKPDLVVGVGDLSYGSVFGQSAVHQHFNDTMAWSQDAAYMPVWGVAERISNRNDNINNYKGRFSLPNPQAVPGSGKAAGEDWYWLDYGNTRLITLPEPTQGAWATWKIKAAALMTQAQSDDKVKYIVTFVNRPAYSSGHYGNTLPLRSLLDSLGDSYSKYVLNINSHSSDYERTTPQHGVVHITAGIGGRNLLQDGSCLWLTCAKPAWSAFRAMHLGALKLDFTNSGIIGAFICGPAGGGVNDVKCTPGSIVDKFTIASRKAGLSNPQAAATASATQATAPVALAATASATTCSKVGLSVSSLIKEGSYGYRINKSFGTPADTASAPTRSILHLFENNVEIGPAHSGHADIRSLGKGRFSHKSAANGSSESLRFSASNNTNPATNGKSYSYCIAGTSSTPSAPSSDTQAPSAPAGLKATAASSSQINLSWSASTDNKAVAGYKIYKNGGVLTTTSGTSYNVTGLSASTTYTFYVAAYDAAGNGSSNSTTVSAKTSAATSAAPAPTACATSPSSSLVVNVQDKGARGNGSANDTAAIQAAVDQVAGTGGTVLVPSGTYMIDAVKNILIKSSLTFRMASGAVLKAIPNNQANYSIIRVQGASNVNIVGGTLQGELDSHSGSSGQYGHGVQIVSSRNVNVEGVTSQKAWGDGFYIGLNSSNVAVCNVTGVYNRRHGLTVTSGTGIVIKNSTFSYQKGTEVSSGIDVEPNQGEYASNIKISGSKFVGNFSSGISSSYPFSSAGGVTGMVLDGNTVANNGTIGDAAAPAIAISNIDGAKVLNNVLKDNYQDGIGLYNSSANNTVTGNTVTGTGIANRVDANIGNGILIWNSGSTGNTVINNTLSGNRVNLRDGVGGNTTSPNNIN